MDWFGSSYSFVERVQLWLSYAIQLILVLAALTSVYTQNWTVVFVSIVSLIAISFPSILSRSYKFHVPLEFHFIITLFIFASLFLGEAHGYYTRFWWWDGFLHTGAGLSFGFVGFLILHSLYREGKLKMSPVLLAVFSFAFAMAIGALWEIFEFSMDTLFGMNMQKSGLLDTMGDLIVNAVGSFVAALSGFLYMKRKRYGIGIFEYYLESFYRKRRAEKERRRVQ